MDQVMPSKLINYSIAMGVLSKTSTPNLVHKTITRSIAVYGCEGWTIRETEKKILTANRLKLFRRTAGYKERIRKGMLKIVGNLMQYHFWIIL